MKRIILVLASCIIFYSSTILALNWSQDMHWRLSEYTHYSEEHFAADLKRVGLPYPPHYLAILVFKNTKTMQIYGRNSRLSKWRYVRSFRILAASGGPGPKLRDGDRQVPEGVYKIIGLNPMSRFDLSMHVNYPDAFDLKYAKLAHRHYLGGNIYIHGSDRSIGCMAIGNAAIQQLFPLVYYVGIHHVTVIIAPDDLRIHKPIYGRVHPWWLPKLYRHIAFALRAFPEPAG